MNRTKSLMLLALAGVGFTAAHPVFADPLAPAPIYNYPDQSTAEVSAPAPPPALPQYEQPPIPGPGYLWTPGYWAYGPAGYYWIAGAWVEPPTIGFLWTPGYWGFLNGLYVFNAGYWGPHVGFYGGIDYGCGYGGFGYEGGYWDHGEFAYNRAVNNISNVNIHNTYIRNVTNNRTINRVSYNGGAGGVTARPRAEELAAARDRHVEPTPVQRQHIQEARDNREGLASVNHGNPVNTRPERGMTPVRDPATPRTAEPHGVAQPHPVATPRPVTATQRGPESRATSEEARTEELNRTQAQHGGAVNRPVAENRAPRGGSYNAPQHATSRESTPQRFAAQRPEPRQTAPERNTQQRTATARPAQNVPGRNFQAHQAAPHTAPRPQVAQRPAPHADSHRDAPRPDQRRT